MRASWPASKRSMNPFQILKAAAQRGEKVYRWGVHGAEVLDDAVGETRSRCAFRGCAGVG